MRLQKQNGGLIENSTSTTVQYRFADPYNIFY